MEVLTKGKNELISLKKVLVIFKEVLLSDKSLKVDKPITKLYAVSFLGSNYYFNTKKELNSFINDNNINKSDIFTIEYLGNYAGGVDVIRCVKNYRASLYSIVNENTYREYDYDNSLKREYPIWIIKYGNLKDFYLAFKKRNVDFEKDYYLDNSFKYIKTYI